MFLPVKHVTSIVVFASFIAILVTSGSLAAQSDQGLNTRNWGVGQPKSASDLPPGQLRRKLESLPPQANAKAIKWLQDFTFTGADLDVMHIDDEGGVFFADTELPDEAGAEQAPAATTPEAIPQGTLNDAFTLHSKPGAPNVVYIDFNGHTITNTAWNSGALATYVAKAYDLDGNPTSFSDTERTRIVDIWHRVAEDLAAFNIDVTTEEPSSFNSKTGRLLVTHNVDANGNNMPHYTAGGVAYVGVFGASNYHTYYSPALMYYNQLSGGSSPSVAEASSHEFGHNLGLSHDATSTVGYYSGHGSGLVSWAPIMGVGYYQNVTQWSKGEYPDANNTQDDLDIINGKLGLRADDHGNTIATGTLLNVASDGTVVSSNPELDPHNVLPENKGIINYVADINAPRDVDVFTFGAGAGTVNLTVRPAWDAFYRATSNRGANMDIKAELRNAAGNLLATNDPTNDTMATINYTVTAGTYHLLISGVGNVISPYSDYASQGMYFINGTVPVASADTKAPTPNPMGWSSVPAANGENAINMTATTAVDDTSSVQYRFNCTSGGAGCVNSNWQSGTAYTATGLAAATQYTFTVVARDSFSNQTTASSPASATTATPPPAPPPPAFVEHVADSDTAVVGSVNGAVGNTYTDNGQAQSITEIESGGKPSIRYTYLEHRWNFNISLGASATVYANAWSGGSTDGDTFDFEYSLNGGGSWNFMFNISATSNANTRSFQLPGTPSGSVIVRVVDTDKSRGARETNTVWVDHLYIQVSNPPTEPPPPPSAPSGLVANGISATQINLSWSHNGNNEDGFRVERRLASQGSFVAVATLGVNASSYSNTGLQGGTAYDYRVYAFNGAGDAASNTVTGSTVATPSISLSANGSKDKGVIVISLSWSGASNVDVFRDGSKIATVANGSSYSDNTGSKGSGTWTHKVCASGSTSNCSNTTTTVF